MSQRNYTITLNEAELKIVLKALGRQPFAEVYELVEKLVRATNAPVKEIPVTKPAPKKSLKKK